MQVIILLILSFATIFRPTLDAELTVNNVYDCIIEKNIYEPRYVLAQAVLETGWFKSYNCTARNNIFGFRYRKWITEGNPKGYKVFTHWEESVGYYQRWQIRKGYRIGEDYIAFLKRVGYAEDPNYGNKVRAVLKLLKKDYGI